MPDRFCVGVSCQECPFCDDPIKDGCKVARFIDAIPAADVVEVVHARPVKFYCDARTGRMMTTCSACDLKIGPYDSFCKNCGAKLDGGKHE